MANVIFTNAETISHADSESQKLEKFARMLPPGEADKRLGQLVIIFSGPDGVAVKYRKRATDLIDQEQDPAKKRYAHSQINEHIREHVALLSDLFQRHPLASSGEICDELEQVIRFLSQQLKGVGQKVHFLKPLIRTSFSYVHIEYVKDNALGIIAIPPELAVSDPGSYEDWSLLWHEIAGYAIARKREVASDKLAEWAGELRDALRANDLLNDYHKLFRDSITQTLVSRMPEWLSISKDIIEKSITPEVDSKWETDWLAEFLEDLFLVRVFMPVNLLADVTDDIADQEKLAPISALINALSKGYSDFTIGDQIHPPPNLRVLAALAYREHSFNSNNFKNAVEELVQQLKGDPYQLTKASQPLALVIAQCTDTIVSQLFNKVSATELRLARLVLGLLPLADAAAVTAAKEDIFKKIASSPLAADIELDDQFIAKINDKNRITTWEELLKLEFVDIDPGRKGPPYWH